VSSRELCALLWVPFLLLTRASFSSPLLTRASGFTATNLHKPTGGVSTAGLSLKEPGGSFPMPDDPVFLAAMPATPLAEHGGTIGGSAGGGGVAVGKRARAGSAHSRASNKGRGAAAGGGDVRARSVSGSFGGFAKEAAMARAGDRKRTASSMGASGHGSHAGDGSGHGSAGGGGADPVLDDVDATRRSTFVALTLALFVSQFMIGMVVPSVSIIWGILGSTGAMAISFVIPSASYLVVTGDPEVAARKGARRGVAMAMLVTSSALCVLCTSTTVIGLL